MSYPELGAGVGADQVNVAEAWVIDEEAKEEGVKHVAVVVKEDAFVHVL